MEASAFLIVFSEPGDLVTLEEFQDWYNNEHVPLRMNHIPSFLTGARFSSLDNAVPSWVAMYEVVSTSIFSDPSYTRLRANRSPREADLVKRLQILDRRTCSVLKDTSKPMKETSTSFAVDNPIRWVVIQGLDADEVLFTQWTERVFSRIKSISTWTRTRTFKCYDNLITGTAVQGKGPDAQNVPQFLMIHELLSPETPETPEFQAATDAQNSGVTITEDRMWKLYRAYPGVAQGNV